MSNRPSNEPNTSEATNQAVRVAAVQYQMCAISDKDEMRSKIEYFVTVAADYGADFIVFPEYFTLQLLSLERTLLDARESIRRATTYTQWFLEFMGAFAKTHDINIIGGTHPIIDDDNEIKNVSYVFLKDGTTHAQQKIHATPNETDAWNIKGGSDVKVIDTDCGPIGVMICYDSEFPEQARYLADQGARLLFVPFCTDDRRGYLRVRYCCHARAIENQCYVVMSGVVGNLPNVANLDIHYAQSGILTPCDFPFARDGIAADANANEETIILADLNLADLEAARCQGTVRNLHDRRFDLYQTNWRANDRK